MLKTRRRKPQTKSRKRRKKRERKLRRRQRKPQTTPKSNPHWAVPAAKFIPVVSESAVAATLCRRTPYIREHFGVRGQSVAPTPLWLTDKKVRAAWIPYGS